MKMPPKVREFFQAQGRIGVARRNRNLSAAERREIARKAAQTRWAKEKKKTTEKPK